MERKNRGTYNINFEKTPIQNLISLLKLTFPLETTIAKMREEDFAKYNEINLLGISIRPSGKYRWDRHLKDTRDLKKFVFYTKTPSNVNYRRSITRSVPIQRRTNKVSLSKVTKIVNEFSSFNQEFEKEQKIIEEQRKIEERKIEEQRKIINKIKT